MTIICIANNKGGSGKSTTAVSLAAGLANTENVLLIDGDSQGQVGMMFGLPVRAGLFDWLVRGLPLRDCTLTGRPSKLSILPSDSLTKSLELRFGNTSGQAQIVEKLRALRHPYVVIDTAPGGLFQEAALKACDHVIIPFRPEPVNMDSLFQTLELIRVLDRRPQVTLLPTIFDARISDHRDTVQKLIVEYGDDYGLRQDWNDYVVRYRVAALRAPGVGQTIWEYSDPSIRDVRRAYTVLMNRVIALAGGISVGEGKVTNGTGN